MEIEILKKYQNGKFSIIELLTKSKMVYKVLKIIYEKNNKESAYLGIRKIGEILGYKNIISKIVKMLEKEEIIEAKLEKLTKRKPRKVPYLTKKGEILFQQAKKRKILILKKRLQRIRKELSEL
ncbi:MAG: hypothetical protein RMJ38_01070 [candidate division WOR-3 bacterium]|nr:hypothetical protein [candidate division WOR-3 bacterium]MDW8150020.1 hypothetical protein [candidate division WOR-3 bacterium]